MVATTAPCSRPLASIVYQSPAHDLGCQSVEVRAILPVHVVAADQLNERIVYQHCRLQILVRPFVAQIGFGTAAQLRFDQAEQLFLGASIAATREEEQGCYVVLGFRHPSRSFALRALGR
jgi:hypothetical protein